MSLVMGHGRPRRVEVAANMDASAVETAADLRRQRKREMIESIVARAEHLPAGDRELLYLLFRDGKKVTDVAALLGADVRRVRRRVKRLIRLVHSPAFAYVALAAEEWPETRRRVAREVFLFGHTLRDAARTLGVSLHLVRKHAEAVRAIVEAAR